VDGCRAVDGVTVVEAVSGMTVVKAGGRPAVVEAVVSWGVSDPMRGVGAGAAAAVSEVRNSVRAALNR
jgi:hypothetical protein